MITKTLNLDEAYQTLFDDVRKASDGAISVDNLEAYYGSIEEIAALDPKFLRLPLDEPLFEIDANTRKIAIPAEFKSNGVSVQRDHLAEIIFFRIARFFDYTDLATCDIVINWKMGANEGKTTRFIKFEEPFLVDEVQTNGIIFGWPINDIVTNKSGALTFAVEFFKKDGIGDDAEVIYRFNTLAASVNIKDGLIISDDAEVYTLDEDIMRTLVNSSFGEGTAAVGNIVWLTGDGQGLVAGEGLGADVVLKDFVPIINLETSIVGGEPSSDQINLYAEGFVDEGTQIRYTDANNEALTAEMLKVVRPRVPAEYDRNSGLAYYASAISDEILSAEEAEAADEVWIAGPLEEGLKYYKAIDGGAFEEAEPTDIATWGKVDAIELFIKVAKITVTGAGSYIIKAQGYKVDNDGNKIGNGDVKATATVTVPAVVAPSAIDVSVSELTSVDTGYSFNEEQTANVMFLNAEDKGLISAEAVVDEFGALQFTWQKKVGEDVDFSAVEEGDIDFQAENASELEVEAPGQYKVSVVNFLNGAYSAPVDSAIITASQLAGRINEDVIEQYSYNGTTYMAVNGNDIPYVSNPGGNIARGVTLKVVVDPAEHIVGQVGELQYQWFKQKTTINEESQPVVELTPIEGATSATYTITSGSGYFVPAVMNNYNGSIYTRLLPVINVVDGTT